MFLIGEMESFQAYNVKCRGVFEKSTIVVLKKRLIKVHSSISTAVVTDLIMKIDCCYV